MNRNVLFLIISLLCCSYVSGQSYKESFMRALNAKNMVKAEEILQEWDLADANDAELYVAYFNFYTVKSQEKAGVINTIGYDKKSAEKALEFITDGIERFPTRFDMRIAKIYMLASLKDYTSFTSEVVDMIEFSDKIKNNWRGSDFDAIEEPVKLFNGAISNFQGMLNAEKNALHYNNMIKIAETMLKYYPKYVQSMIDMSTAYVRLNKYDKSLEVLLKASSIEPKNAIVHYNLAYVYNLKGNKVNAKKHYELVVTNATEKEQALKEGAQKHLKEFQ